MNLVISQSGKPIYEQIYEQISLQIMNGELKANSCLPSIRAVAKELRISVITVNAAYELLENNNFIYKVQGKGCFIKEHPQKSLESKKIDIATNKLKKDLKFYKELGLTEENLIDLIKQNFN